MNKISKCISLIICITWAISTKAQIQKELFRDATISMDIRVKDLISKLSLKEKVLQMQENTPAIERLNIPAYNWWNEALHGVARSGDTVTVFPQAIGMAANFDVASMVRMGEITSDEARAIYHEALRKGKTDQRYKGLTFWTPNINIFRDPRWGRGQETYGEDPYLTGQLGMAIVRGLQGNDPKYLKTSACAKHFAVHSGPEKGRHEFDVNISNADLWNTYLPAFQNLVVDAKVSSVMCAYNRFRGKPCCGNDNLMVDILRKQWGFTGYVTSDCGAISDFWLFHKTHKNVQEASAAAVKMGTDLECGEYWKNLWSYPSLENAVKEGLLDEKNLDASLARLFTIRMRLGMFDAPTSVPYSKIPISILNSVAHQDHALKVARQSIVMLKNDGILPLSKKIKHIAVVGPNADDPEVQLGNYNGIPKKNITVLEGIRLKLGSNVTITYHKASTHTGLIKGAESVNTIVENASKADIILFVGGISPRLEGEDGDVKENSDGFVGGDRTTIQLPTIQTDIMKQLKKTGKPLIFVNMSGSSMGMEWEVANTNAIIQAWYGGQSAGTAIADILFGDYNPSGKLPITFYQSEKNLPAFTDYSMNNRTYRYFTGKVLFPFGFGLSYTNFSYAFKNRLGKEYSKQDTLTVSIKITNIGKREGDEVAQVYVKYPQGNQSPLKELKAFKRINLTKRGKETISFKIPISALQKWNESKKELDVATGRYELFVGGNSSDEKIKTAFYVK
jgi:beta-glucosidase